MVTVVTSLHGNPSLACLAWWNESIMLLVAASLSADLCLLGETLAYHCLTPWGLRNILFADLFVDDDIMVKPNKLLLLVMPPNDIVVLVIGGCKVEPCWVNGLWVVVTSSRVKRHVPHWVYQTLTHHWGHLLIGCHRWWLHLQGYHECKVLYDVIMVPQCL